MTGAGGVGMPLPMKYDGCGGWLYAVFCQAIAHRYCASCISVNSRVDVGSGVL